MIMKYIIGLLAICFCLALSVDVGAVEQPIKTEFARAQAPIVFCEPIEVDFACVPILIEATAPTHPIPPSDSHGNMGRSCCALDESIVTAYPKLQSLERYRPQTDTSLASVSAKWPDNCLSDWKVGWQA